MKKFFTKKRIIILVVCVLVIVAYCFRCSAKAEADPAETPIAPFPFESFSPVSPEPSSPADIGEDPGSYSPPYNTTVGYRYYAVERGVQEGVFWYMDIDGNVGSSKPTYKNASYSGQTVNIADTWTKKGTECSYDKGKYVFEFNYSYRNNITNISDGDKLSYRFYITNLEMYDSQSLETIVNIPIVANVTLTCADEFGNIFYVNESFESSSLTSGIAFDIELDGIYTVKGSHVEIMILTYTGGGGSFRASEFWYFTASNIRMVDSYHPAGLESKLKRLFVPDPNDFQSWFNTHADDEWLGSFKTVWLAGVNFIKGISDRAYDFDNVAPEITIPELFITVNNEKHVFFNGYTFNFSTLPPTLIQWVKTAVSVPIVCGFAAYCVHKIYDFIASRFLRSTDKNTGGDSE